MSKFSFINKIKLNIKTRLIKQIALLCAVLMVLVVAVFGWLSANEGTADATGLSVTMGTSDTMLISLDGGRSFHSNIDLLSEDFQQYISEANSIKDKLSMQDITSDGKTFYRPKFNETDGQRIPDTSENWENASKNRAYITQDVVFRTNKKSNIYMGSDTKIITSCELENKSLVSDNPNEIGNKSSAGNFSNDCIVGALRISAIDTSAQGNPCRFVCIPRPDVELVMDGDTITMNTGDNLSGSNEIHTHYDSTYQTSGETIDDWNAITGFNGTQLITTTVYNETTGFYEATATINVWLEGCDPEVTRLLSGGKYKVTFDFISVETN